MTTNMIARASVSEKLYLERLAHNCPNADRILAGQLRIEVVNLCNPDQNIELLTELSQCANAAEEITVLTRWKAELGELARLYEVERLARELVQAIKAWQLSPSHEVSAWMRQARMDLERILVK